MVASLKEGLKGPLVLALKKAFTHWKLKPATGKLEEYLYRNRKTSLSDRLATGP